MFYVRGSFNAVLGILGGLLWLLLPVAAWGQLTEAQSEDQIDTPPVGEEEPEYLPEAPRVGQLDDLTVFHKIKCTPKNKAKKLVVFLPGTNSLPRSYRLFVQFVGDRTGYCTMSVPYQNFNTVGTCCTTTGDQGPDAAQDVLCSEAVQGARARANPSQYTCTNGDTYGISYQDSIEGGIKRALKTLRLKKFYAKVRRGIKPRWSRIILAGHSQGGLMSGFIGINLHKLAGVGHLAGGSIPIGMNAEENFIYGPYWTRPPLTPITLHRAFHHAKDAAANRRQAFLTIGIPEQNIRETDFISEPIEGESSFRGCSGRHFHRCTIMDWDVPLDEAGVPVFIDEWLRLIGE